MFVITGSRIETTLVILAILLIIIISLMPVAHGSAMESYPIGYSESHCQRELPILSRVGIPTLIVPSSGAVGRHE